MALLGQAFTILSSRMGRTLGLQLEPDDEWEQRTRAAPTVALPYIPSPPTRILTVSRR